MITDKNLIDLIPSKNTYLVAISSRSPIEIINLLDQVKQYDAILLTNNDVFRYTNDKSLIEYIANDKRTFYNATLGYKNFKVLDNYYILSFPKFFFQRQKNSLLTKLDTLSYGYSCLNNRAAIHRLALGYKLWKNNLLNQVIFSQNDWGMPCGFEEVLLNRLENFDKYKKTFPLVNSRDPVDRSSWVNDHSVAHPAYYEAYCNIATESETEFFMFEGDNIPTPVITEKSYKPFISGQVPIWLASPGHVNYLKSLKFECMEDLLSSNYDTLDTFAKIEKIVNLVAKGKDFIEDYYHTNWNKIKHNHELVNGDYVDDLIIKNIKNLIL